MYHVYIVYCVIINIVLLYYCYWYSYYIFINDIIIVKIDRISSQSSLLAGGTLGQLRTQSTVCERTYHFIDQHSLHKTYKVSLIRYYNMPPSSISR
jgi:capsule polysaccharide export protein KpsE/RkpR